MRLDARFEDWAQLSGHLLGAKNPTIDLVTLHALE
jgi:hypothetical protein